MCECVKTINEKLKPLNGRLAYGFTINCELSKMEVSDIIIETEKINSRGKKPPIVLASFCPFCGEATKHVA